MLDPTFAADIDNVKEEDESDSFGSDDDVDSSEDSHMVLGQHKILEQYELIMQQKKE